MTDINIAFCRSLLTQAVKELKEKHPKIRPMKDGWVWHTGFRHHWEFHGPDKFYWHGTADNAYEARFKGWMAWIAKQDEKLVADVNERVGRMHR
jgi:hypothetical protein